MAKSSKSDVNWKSNGKTNCNGKSNSKRLEAKQGQTLLGEFPIGFFEFMQEREINWETSFLFKYFLCIRLLVASYLVFIYNPISDWLALEFFKNCPG
jgi:hypothetical protein